LERCRPELLGQLDYPSNPFPWRNREHRQHARLSPAQLHAILGACERDIARIRALRATAGHPGSAAQQIGPAPEQPQALDPFDYIDAQFGGILPDLRVLAQNQHRDFRAALRAAGGLQSVRDSLYPTADTIMPYYLAILIHTAGNPEAIAALRTDCLQRLPLLADREAVVWDKPRAGSVQRRSFQRTAPLEPPALIREIIEWTQRLRPRAPVTRRDRLFLFKSPYAVTSLDETHDVLIRRRFAARHALPDFQLASIRPSVLTAFYRTTGDLSCVRAIANHASLSTTVAYVQEPFVQAQNQLRVAMLQHAFLGHLLRGDRADVPRTVTPRESASAQATVTDEVPSGAAVSMFGFSCRDPFAGIAPGTRKGELCTNFLGCLTCPNAILASDALTLARLLQARDHLKEAAQRLHPARWAGIYAPQLRILEEDILTRFSAHQLTTAQALRSKLPLLPPLR
jgi:hypothetical protein